MSKLTDGWYVTPYRKTPAHWHSAADKWGRIRTAISGTSSDIDSDLEAAGDVSHCKLCERALAKRKATA